MTHAVSNGRRYRYYMCETQDKRRLRIPAFEIENAVTKALAQFLSDPGSLTDGWTLSNMILRA